MNGATGGPPAWRSIEEQGEAVHVLRGLLAFRPAVYDRYYARLGRPGLAERCVEILRNVSALAFSAVMHCLVFVLLAEFVYISLPAIEETLVTVQLYRSSPVAEAPSPPSTAKAEEQKFERAAEAPRTADEPKPQRVPDGGVIGSGASEIDARPQPIGVLENIQTILETGAAHLTGSGLIDARQEGGRRSSVGRYGGTLASEAAVELGLRWLALHQSDDGGWYPGQFTKNCPPNSLCGTHRGSNDAMSNGTTGLALLAFLGAGNTHKEGKYRDTVDRAITWLLRHQDDDGFFNAFTQGGTEKQMYGHGICTFALGEACAMTRDDALRPSLTRAVHAIEVSQQSNGGWYYTNDPKQKQSEFTLSVWQMMGLKAAKLAGVEIPEKTVQKAIEHVKNSTDSSGGVYYAGGSNITMGATGAGLFARCMFGFNEAGAIDRGLSYLDRFQQQEPVMGRQQNYEYVYYWYYRTLVTFQVQGRPWREWNRKFRPFLVSHQRSKGHAAGSWTAVDYQVASTLYSTAMCVLMLETYYRYLPMASDRSALEAVLSAADPAEESMTPEEEAKLAEFQPAGPETPDLRRQKELELARARVKSEKPEDRYLGARKLAEFVDKESARDLIEAARKADARLRAVHVHYVGKVRSEEAIPFLISQLDDADETVVGAAVMALTNTTGVYIAEAARWKEWYVDHLKRRAEGK